MILTAIFLIGHIPTVVVTITDPHPVDTLPIITLETGTRGRSCLSGWKYFKVAYQVNIIVTNVYISLGTKYKSNM